MTEPARPLPESEDHAAPDAHASTGQAPALRLVAMREHSLLALSELSLELDVSLDPEALTRLGVLNLMGQMGTSRAALWLRGGEARGLALAHAHGVAVDMTSVLGGILEGVLPRWIERGGRPVRVNEADEELSPIAASLATQLEFGVLAPLYAGREPRGCLALGHRESGEAYSDFDLEVLRTSLGMVGVAVHNAELFGRVREQNDQLARANSALRELDRMKSEFLQNVNHELRTPITVVIGAIECLLSEPGADSRRSAILRAAREDAEKLKRMVQSILELSEGRSGAHVRNPMPFDPRLVVGSFAEAWLQRIESGGRGMRLSARSSRMALGDPAGVTKILELLVDNAIRFTPPGTTIELVTSDGDDANRNSVCFVVQDDGPGIAADKLPLIFEAFSQGDGSTTRAVGGLGLGLARARRTAERMGGELTARNVSGGGASFTLRLPKA